MTEQQSQSNEIRKHLLEGKSLTALGALGLFNCMRLSARIWDLREQGMEIHMERVRVGRKTIAKYRARI